MEKKLLTEFEMGLNASRWLVSLIYLLLILIGGVLSVVLPISDLWLKLLAIDVVLTLIVFAVGLAFKNDSMYDLYWSVIPFAMLFYWLYSTEAVLLNPRQIMLILLLSWWSWRLSFNWFRGWKGMTHEDWRYVDLRAKTGRWYPLVSLLGIQLFPTIIVFFAALPMQAIFESTKPMVFTDIMGGVFMLAGILLELFSDRQMHRFRLNAGSEAVMNRGLWKYSRHPNYLGEILFWWGIYLLSLATSHQWLLVTGPLLVTFLFLFISIPLMEKRMLARRPAYKAYRENTPALIPLKFWK